MAADTTSIEVAAERFYHALASLLNGDGSEMSAIYEHSDTASAFQPAGEPALGWAAVEGSFAGLSQLVSEAEISPTILQAVGGEDMGYTIGLERVRAKLAGETISFEHRATNVFRKIDGEWKVVHHHIDTDEQVSALVARLMGAQQPA
jgi:ketosteroid isomerase-like protein